MLQSVPIPIRVECPPGSCTCERDRLQDDPAADQRPLRLTRAEEARLIARIERVDTYADLLHVQRLVERNLGAALTIVPGPHEVRTVRGIVIRLEEQPGLCRKVRQSVPAAVRRMLDRRPEVAWAILDADGLFGAS
ncbi:hypothetical protein [uncultured Massilia sp.]|uniref:hypothetical protein n=1 Tax=uncultured Massilia sp. TaxID=169973 RepID=UPI0025D8FB6B|nr:hypothetical protein [uncultured Massilia sp.]